jgi:transcriptional regulator with XRE-family HTH domain
MSELKKIGNRIKEARNSKGLSQEEVAFRADMDRAYLSEIESGLKNLSVSVLLKICKAIEIKPEDIIKGL